MDIAAMSTMMSQAKVQQQASLSVMKMAMDAGKTEMNEMTKSKLGNTSLAMQPGIW
ncbi:YjfB family protein [Clostridium cochlearium]|uniref:YjfB family protein n=1 Tax=Clostridium cochlearium TaxID=1494 RepID=UPI00214A41AE|nr:YjfB family protein [Clostridium cochlearium]MCR1971701.1 YjfB family protein [Clostridium cochlearium]